MPSGLNCPCLRLPRIFTPYQCRPFSSLRIIQNPPLQPRSSSFHSTGEVCSRKRRERNDYFSSSAPHFIQQDAKLEKHAKTEETPQNNKRKNTRSQAAKNSLRRVAVEAQRSRDGKVSRKTPAAVHQATSKVGYSPGVFYDYC